MDAACRQPDLTWIDLRSDAVTQPTSAMRQAMAQAEVGDDGYGEDPTVNALEARASALTGMPAAIFVSSGTLGNLMAVFAHTQRGDEVICGYRSHVFHSEQAAMATLGSVQAYPIREAEDGTLPLDAVAQALRTEGRPRRAAGLISVENTHNLCGGRVLNASNMRALGDLADEYGAQLHVDGARLFNAAVADGCTIRDFLQGADSVMFCLSKGLCAPVGSVLCGSQAFIKRARQWRRMLGRNMRQAGIVAAAGIVALDTMVPRLVEDHVCARIFAEGVLRILIGDVRSVLSKQAHA